MRHRSQDGRGADVQLPVGPDEHDGLVFGVSGRDELLRLQTASMQHIAGLLAAEAA